MNVRIFFIAGCLAALSLSACRNSTQADTSRRDALLQTDTGFSQASIHDGFAAAFAQYAENDALLLPQGAAALRGEQQVAQSLAGLAAGTRISWTPQAASVSDKLGYTWGIYTLSGGSKTGQATLAYGKYLSVWQRQGDDWKLAVMMTNQSPGPAG